MVTRLVLLCFLTLALSETSQAEIKIFEKIYRSCAIMLYQKIIRVPKSGLTPVELEHLSQALSENPKRNSTYLLWGNPENTDAQILALVDPVLDPFLDRWIRQNIPAQPNHERSEIDRIAVLVKSAFYRSSTALQDLASYIRYLKINRESTKEFDILDTPKQSHHFVKLGDILRNGIGVCRHHAILLALSLKRMGYVAKVVGGDVYRADLLDLPTAKDFAHPDGYFSNGMSSSEIAHLGGHAWVEVELDGRTYWLDAFNNIPSLEVSSNQTRLRIEVKPGAPEKDVYFELKNPHVLNTLDPREISSQDFEAIAQASSR